MLGNRARRPWRLPHRQIVLLFGFIDDGVQSDTLTFDKTLTVIC